MIVRPGKHDGLAPPVAATRAALAVTVTALLAAAWLQDSRARPVDDSGPVVAAADTTRFRISGGAVDSLAILAARPDTTDLWLPADAARDSLDAFWQGLDHSWLEPFSSELMDFGLGPAEIDSLSRVGDEAVADMLAGRLWRMSWRPLSRLGFNRAEGLRPGLAWRLRRVGPHPPELELGAGYGVASERFVYDGRLTVPLLTARRTLASGLPAGRSWPLLAVELHGGRRVRMFAGDGRRIRDLTAFLYGADPNQYYKAKYGRASLLLRPWRWLSLRAGILREDHDRLPVATTWNLTTDRRDVPANLQVSGVRTKALIAGLGVYRGRWRLHGYMQWHRVFDGGLLDFLSGQSAGAEAVGLDRADFRRLQLSLDGGLLDRFGNEYALKARWVSMDRQAPLQWKSYLGDYNTLRGFEAREIAGDQAGWASLDIRWGFDLLRALRVPIFGKLGLQPITFAEYGRAIALDGPLTAGPEVDPEAGPGVYPGKQGWSDGWRADVGFGFGKLIGVPGHSGVLRVYAARPVGRDMGDRPWRFVVGFEN